MTAPARSVRGDGHTVLCVPGDWGLGVTAVVPCGQVPTGRSEESGTPLPRPPKPEGQSCPRGEAGGLCPPPPPGSAVLGAQSGDLPSPQTRGGLSAAGRGVFPPSTAGSVFQPRTERHWQLLSRACGERTPRPLWLPAPRRSRRTLVRGDPGRTARARPWVPGRRLVPGLLGRLWPSDVRPGWPFSCGVSWGVLTRLGNPEFCFDFINFKRKH